MCMNTINLLLMKMVLGVRLSVASLGFTNIRKYLEHTLP